MDDAECAAMAPAANPKRHPRGSQAIVLPGLVLTNVLRRYVHPREIPVRCIVDSGAGSCFINKELIPSIRPFTEKLEPPVLITLADGLQHECHEVAPVTLCLGTWYRRRIRFHVITMSYDVVLGKTWLTDHNQDIDWREHTVSFW